MTAGLSGVEIVRNARARRARLSVDPVSGCVRLTLPPRAPLKASLEWVDAHRDWIVTQQARLPVARPFVPGAVIPFGDDSLTIHWEEERSRVVTREGGVLRCGGPKEAIGRRVEAWLKREARHVLDHETAHYAAKAGVEVTSVGIGDPKGRWGSCSSRGVIRYSWRLILAPAFVRRATVAHEVAHRVHMNHGAAFHALVAALFEGEPDAARRWLRTHGAALHWYGRES